MNNGRPIIEVSHLTYQYHDGTRAIRDISLTVDEGDFVALIGTNGCGKTTLSKCLNGILKATGGSIVIDGKDVNRTPSEELIKSIGYVFQDPDHQLFNNSVYDEIAYAPRNLRLPREEVDARVREAAKIAGVDEALFGENPFFQVSGIRQRIAIASILSLKPKVIIVDEPTTGQDYRQSIEVMEFLKMLNEKQGHTIIIITHEMEIVAEYAHKVFVMNDGQILLEGTPEEVYSQPEKLERASIKPPQITRLGQKLRQFGFASDILSPADFIKAWQTIIA